MSSKAVGAQTLEGDLRCSSWARGVGLDPIGSAGSYDGYLLVEWPLPWPSDLGEIAELGPVALAARAAGVRLQGLVPDGAGEAGGRDRVLGRRGARVPPERLRVACYHRRLAAPGVPSLEGLASSSRGALSEDLFKQPWYQSLGLVEVHVPASEVPDAAIALLAAASNGDGHGPGAGGLSRGSSRSFGPDQASSEVLVCTHGRRDRCCGSLGTALVADLVRPAGEAGTSVAAGVGLDARLSRTSHTGGHRFAPTAAVFPEGTLWAYLNATLLGEIVRHSCDPAVASPHYRGCPGLGAREVQVLEREVLCAGPELASPGWSLLDLPMRGID